MKKELRDVLVVTKLYLIWWKRMPFSAVVYLVIQPVILAIFLRFLLGSNRAYGYVGAIAMMISGMSLMGLAQDLVRDKWRKVKEIYVSMPISPMAYVLGYSLGGFLTCLPTLGILFGMMLADHVISVGELPLVLLASLISWIPLSGLGFLIGSMIRDVLQIGPITSLIYYLTIFALPVFWPLRMIFPQVNSGLTAFGYFLANSFPTISLAEALRVIVNQGYVRTPFDPLLALFFEMVISGAIFFILFSKKAKWRERRVQFKIG